MSDALTLIGLNEDLKELRILHNDLVARVIAVENKAKIDRDEQQQELRNMQDTLLQVKNKVDSLESLEDANFMAITHMLGVIARKLKIPNKEMKTGAR